MLRSLFTFSSSSKMGVKKTGSAHSQETTPTVESCCSSQEETSFGKHTLKTLNARKNDPIKQSRTDFGLAVFYKDHGDLTAAKKHIMEAHKVRKMHLGPHHPLVAATFEVLGDIAEQSSAWEEAKSHYEHALKTIQSNNNNSDNNSDNNNPECAVVLSLVHNGEDGIYEEQHIQRRVKQKLQRLLQDHPTINIVSTTSMSVSNEMSSDSMVESPSLNRYDSMPIVTTILSNKPARRDTLPIVQGQIKHQSTRDKNDDILFLPISNQQNQNKYSQQSNSRANSYTSDISFVPSENNTRRHTCPHKLKCDEDDDDEDDDIQFAPSSDNYSVSSQGTYFSKRDRQKVFQQTEQKMPKNVL